MAGVDPVGPTPRTSVARCNRGRACGADTPDHGCAPQPTSTRWGRHAAPLVPPATAANAWSPTSPISTLRGRHPASVDPATEVDPVGPTPRTSVEPCNRGRPCGADTRPRLTLQPRSTLSGRHPGPRLSPATEVDPVGPTPRTS